MGKGKVVGRLVTPVAIKAAPGLASGFVRQAFDRAVDGVGPLRGAAQAADLKVIQHDGNVGRAIGSFVEGHARLAGMQGFVTNLGGLFVMTVAVPANVSGLALLQAHMVGGIAHLRGYDLADPRVRDAVLACMLGEETVKALVKRHKLPTRPMGLATAPHHDPRLADRLASEVAAELLARAAGKRTMAAFVRKLPVLGGGVGMVTDGYTTYQVGRYAAHELKPRPRDA